MIKTKNGYNIEYLQETWLDNVHWNMDIRLIHILNIESSQYPTDNFGSWIYWEVFVYWIGE